MIYNLNKIKKKKIHNSGDPDMNNYFNNVQEINKDQLVIKGKNQL